MSDGRKVALAEIVSALELKTCGGATAIDGEITGGITSDLLSFVMASGSSGDIWLTIQTHPNILAVAALVSIKAVVICSGFEPDEETLIRADEEGIPVLKSPLSAFELAGRLSEMGIR